ncbi:MAG TPA: PorP/SprF family type IX secretion system membrane protein [Bacteroidia bacterium]|jgi:type IX secretion system PorP/SprF family membrane protein
MNKNNLILFFLFLCIGSSYAQDIHYSQFNASPQNLNPAQTGLFDGDWRFAGNYRSQWSAIPVPYKTFSLAGDTRLKTRLENDVPGVGLQINNDKSGDSRFGTTQVLLSGSYIKKLTKDSAHFLSVAIQPGITTKSFNVNALTFDNQYDGDQYNASLASGENFSRTRITYFDMGAGFVYYWRKTNRTKVNFGVSAFHLNRPKQSFFNDDDIRLDIKTTVSGLGQIPVAAKLDILPSFMYQRQGKFQETLLGLFGKYHLKGVNGLETAVSLGAFYRVKDAFILAANVDYRNFNVGISYDVNTSKLIEATNRRGGFEISVIYIFKKIVPFVAKKRVCPIYM